METVETMFKLEQGSEIKGSVMAEVESLPSGNKVEFKLNGLDCRVNCNMQLGTPEYYTGYVNLPEPITEEQYEKIKDLFKDEVTYRNDDTLGFDMVHAHNLEEGTTKDSKLCLDIVEDLTLVINKVFAKED